MVNTTRRNSKMSEESDNIYPILSSEESSLSFFESSSAFESSAFESSSFYQSSESQLSSESPSSEINSDDGDEDEPVKLGSGPNGEPCKRCGKTKCDGKCVGRDPCKRCNKKSCKGGCTGKEPCARCKNKKCNGGCCGKTPCARCNKKSCDGKCCGKTPCAHCGRIECDGSCVDSAKSAQSSACSSKKCCKKKCNGQCNKCETKGYDCSEQKHESPETPKHKLEIEKNDIPENWWDKLPDFDPRVYDAMMIGAAGACVNYIMADDIDKLELKMEARKLRKSKTVKTQVPRTTVAAPTEITYDTKIDDFIKTDVAY